MKISYQALKSIRKRHHRKKIVFCSGGFDLTHAGHLLFFEDCKRHGDILVVGVASDATRRKERGPARPILNEHLRLAMVNGLRPVDYTFLISELAKSGEYPHRPLGTIFERLQPDMYIINDDVSDLKGKKKFVESFGVRFLALSRSCPPEFEKISTTNIIKKIKKYKSGIVYVQMFLMIIHYK